MPYVSYSDQQQYVPQAEQAAADAQRANDTIGAQNQVLRMRLDQMLRREAALEASRSKAKFAHDQAVQNQANEMQRLTVLEGGRNARFNASEAAKAKHNTDQMEQQDRQHHESIDGLQQRGEETAINTTALLNNRLVDSAVKSSSPLKKSHLLAGAY